MKSMDHKVIQRSFQNPTVQPFFHSLKPSTKSFTFIGDGERDIVMKKWAKPISRTHFEKI